MREVIHIDLGEVRGDARGRARGGARLIGTHHPPRAGMGGGLPAVLLLNFGDMYRAGPSDLSAHLADDLSRQGHHAFRFDMPGLGDSPGELPAHQETYWRFVQQGGQVECVCRLIEVLAAKYGIAQFVLGGLCGGAVTTTLVGQRLRRRVAGLLLLEPSVELTDAIPFEQMPGAAPSVALRLRRRLHQIIARVRGRMRRLSFLSRLVCRCRIWRRGDGPAKLEQAQTSPRNVPLIRAWRLLAAEDMPMLVVLAPGPSRPTITSLLSAMRRNRITMVYAEQTSHLLNVGRGPAIVCGETCRWLRREFGRETMPPQTSRPAATRSAA